MNPPDRPQRPRDLALLLLAAGDDPPRQRARDQQADLAGAALRRRVLDRLAALDPEPDGLEAALARIVAELGEPSGPTRGIGSTILQDWQAAQASPDLWAWLVAEAVQSESRGRKRHGPE
jgi:hypothetical protein